MKETNNTIINRQLKQKEDLIAQIKKTPIIQVACQRIGISRSTYYRWRKKDEAFSEIVDESLLEGKHLVNDLAESQLISAIKDRNMTAIIFWLKNHHKNYTDKLELSGKIKTEADKLNPEQEELLRQAIKLAGVENDKKGGNKNGD